MTSLLTSLQKKDKGEEGRYKDCYCSPYEDSDPNPSLVGLEDYDLDYVVDNLVPWQDDWDITSISPICRGAKVTALKHLGPTNIYDAILSFCQDLDNTELDRTNTSNPFLLGHDIMYNIYPINDTTAFWLSANYRPGVPDYWECGLGAMISEHECTRVLNYT